MNLSFETDEDIHLSPINNKNLSRINNNAEDPMFQVSSPCQSPPPLIRRSIMQQRENEEKRDQPVSNRETSLLEAQQLSLEDNPGNSNDPQLLFSSTNINNSRLHRNEPLLTRTVDGEAEYRQPPPVTAPVAHYEEMEEQRRQREEEDSIALAQQLMAEEAMASHRMSADFLRMNSDQFSEEDFAALQNALQEEDYGIEQDSAQEEDEERELSYDALLRLGERIGDVKTDRWVMIADKEIAKLELFQYDPEKVRAKSKEEVDDSELKCLVCQYNYEKGEDVRRLPCGHCFHKDCVDQWLKEKDICVYCRQSICCDDNDDKNNLK